MWRGRPSGCPGARVERCLYPGLYKQTLWSFFFPPILACKIAITCISIPSRQFRVCAATVAQRSKTLRNICALRASGRRERRADGEAVNMRDQIACSRMSVGILRPGYSPRFYKTWRWNPKLAWQTGLLVLFFSSAWLSSLSRHDWVSKDVWRFNLHLFSWWPLSWINAQKFHRGF